MVRVGVMVGVGVFVSVGVGVEEDVGVMVTVGLGAGKKTLPIVNTPQHNVITPNNRRIGIANLDLGFLKI